MVQQLKDSCLGCRVIHCSQHYHGCLGFLTGGVWNLSDMCERMQALKDQTQYIYMAKEALGGFFHGGEIWEQWMYETEYLDPVSDCVWENHVNAQLIIRGRVRPYLD